MKLYKNRRFVSWKLWRLCGRIAFWFGWPLLFLYLKKSERTRVIILRGDRILVVKSWLGSGHWILPGGGLHLGEEPVAGAIRETLEETSVQLLPEQLQYLGKYHQTKGFRTTYHLFSVNLDALPVTRPQRFEIVDLQWLSEEEILAENKGESLTHVALRVWRGYQ